jgi:choline-sulfatase
VLPHFPLIGPPELYDYYEKAGIPRPRQDGADERPAHPAVRSIAECMNYGDYFDDEQVRIGRIAYYAMTTAMDQQVGKLLDAVRESGQWENTRIVYCSDHGDNLGNRGLWGKSVMFEESAAIPMIVAGADVPRGAVVDTPVSLVDVYPTIVEAAGSSLSEEERAVLDGHSLIDIANGATPDRTVLSEYHAAASVTGSFMIRVGKWKYVHHVGFAPELYDMEADRRETKDLGEDPAQAETVAMCEAKLREIVDPEAATEKAFRDQEERIALHGGEEAIKQRGDFGYTPAPGERPNMVN